MKAIKFVEKYVGYKQGKGGAWKTCITVKKDVEEEDAAKFLKSTEEEHPRIVVFSKGGQNEIVSIVGDSVVVNVKITGMEYVLVVLLAAYYVFDLAYPRKYSQFLGILQHIAIGDKFLDPKSTGFLNLLSKIENLKRPEKDN